MSKLLESMQEQLASNKKKTSIEEETQELVFYY